MSGIAAAAIVAGAGISAGGGMLSAAAGNRAARQQRDFADVRTGQNMDRTLGLLGGEALVRRRYDAGSGTAVGSGDKWFQKNADLSGVALGQQAFGSGGAVGQMKNTIQYARKQGAKNLQDFRNGAAGVLDLSRASEGTARQYGRGAETLIDQETQRAIQAANATTLARANATGMGGTSVATDQMSGNILNATRAGAESKIGVRKDTLDRVLQAQGRTAGLAGELNTQGTNLAQGNVDRNTQLRDQYAKTLLAIMQGMGGSTTFNPPGYSPAGQAAGAGGSTLSGLGGLLLAQNLLGGGSTTGAAGGSNTIAANGIANSTFGYPGVGTP